MPSMFQERQLGQALERKFPLVTHLDLNKDPKCVIHKSKNLEFAMYYTVKKDKRGRVSNLKRHVGGICLLCGRKSEKKSLKKGRLLWKWGIMGAVLFSALFVLSAVYVYFNGTWVLLFIGSSLLAASIAASFNGLKLKDNSRLFQGYKKVPLFEQNDYLSEIFVKYAPIEHPAKGVEYMSTTEARRRKLIR
jgi:hypothetical protein